MIVGGIVGAIVVHGVLYHFAQEFAKRTTTDVDTLLFKNTRKSARLVLVFLTLQLLLPVTPIAEPLGGILRHIVAIGLIVSITWLVIRAIGVIDDMILARHPIGVRDNLRARQIHTKTRVLSRSLVIIVSIVGVAAVLMTFDSVRRFGESLLAGAGIAGILIGFAARATISNLIAGVQLALTQPIRIDDVVIVEGEWGWIEEIRSTFVIVKIWDDRRLVVPLNYFIEKPFQNWTRKTADLLGSIFIHADYRLPVQRVREELEKIVKECEEWDGRVCVLQVTDAKEQTIELRALVSAGDSPTCWDLRCKVREKLVGF
ncbi:MAG: mechanosensitive ion channel, partial [Phycisphaerales bacterium]|nr:mechanosensitive ion channel [Phycisphaerales bacterium]